MERERFRLYRILTILYARILSSDDVVQSVLLYSSFIKLSVLFCSVLEYTFS